MHGCLRGIGVKRKLTVLTRAAGTLDAVPSEGLTFALAVIGAGGSVAQVDSIARDRPSLRTSFGFVTRISQSPRSYIGVTNSGPRATTVREVGFYARPIESALRSVVRRRRI